ncbi:hypothetical protein SCHPADRAFT_930384 [Schizopora paradoxa]|uniref:Fungal-type protein kinase domain-containing protein n=1 Tax=Schizopora paradoxa TaxID=27342 RepID=A0A0H2S0Y7_9AGAM|nr:hypothetical protein SCHPADRAFT_930384 [Schizopora paradoxa]
MPAWTSPSFCHDSFPLPSSSLERRPSTSVAPLKAEINQNGMPEQDSRSFVEKNIKTATRRRAIIGPFGRKLHAFTSTQELMKAFGDIIYTVCILHNYGFVHRDISIRNIFLNEHKSAFQGFLVDYSYAKRASYEASAKRIRVETVPFMAFTLMKKKPKLPHSHFHDLESIFYVICWTCIVYRGPGPEKREIVTRKKPYRDTVVARWNGEGERDLKLEYLTFKKFLTIIGEGFNSTIDEFAAHFDDIKEFAEIFGGLVFKERSVCFSSYKLQSFEEKKAEIDRRFEAASSDEQERMKSDYNALPIDLRPPSDTGLSDEACGSNCAQNFGKIDRLLRCRRIQ